MTIRRKRIRAIAERLLAELSILAAPIPVEDIAETLGTVVQRIPTDDDLSGFLYAGPAMKKAVIGVNANHHPNRQRFTIAHELGHFLLHDVEEVHVDRAFTVKLRSRTSSEGTDREEKEANLFAAEVLMPKDFIEADLQEIDAVDLEDDEQILALARRYGVSAQAMTIRLGYLGCVEM